MFVASAWAPFLFFRISTRFIPLFLLLIICSSSDYFVVFLKVHQGEIACLAGDEKVCFVASAWAPFLFFMMSPLVLFPLVLLLISCSSYNYLIVFSKVHQGEIAFLTVEEKVCFVQLSCATRLVAHCILIICPSYNYLWHLRRCTGGRAPQETPFHCPQVMPRELPQLSLQVSLEVSPEVTTEPSCQVTPEVLSQVLLKLPLANHSLEVSPEVTTEVAYQVFPELFLQVLMKLPIGSYLLHQELPSRQAITSVLSLVTQVARTGRDPQPLRKGPPQGTSVQTACRVGPHPWQSLIR